MQWINIHGIYKGHICFFYKEPSSRPNSSVPYFWASFYHTVKTGYYRHDKF